MAEIPANAPRSEDGNYWWDGSQWQLVAQAHAQGQQVAQAQPAHALTDEHFANMIASAENGVVES